jgi:uncharacterized membrane protein
MNQKKTMISKYLVLAVLAIIAIWQITSGKSDFGIGLLAGLIMAAVALGIKNRQLGKVYEKGMNPYDERVWSIAGKASYAAMRVFVIIIALFVLIGSVWGPDFQVNPYNLLGICLSGLVFLYVCFYYYFNRKY